MKLNRTRDKELKARFGSWIPCNKRLPDKNSSVLVCFDDGFVWCAEYIDDWELWADSGEVVAWMPLPRPYINPELKSKK
jgi:hypothetical protein